MANEFLTGDTVRIQVSFKDNLNALADPDSNEAFFSVYDAEDTALTIVDEVTATRSSQGVYYYDYTTPDDPTKLIVEMKGLFSALPQVERATIRVKFK